MDGSTSNKYYVEDADVAAGTVNVWVQWASIGNVPVVYNRLRFYTGSEDNRRPRYLSVQASHGNDIWDVLWESSSVSLSASDNYFSFENDEAYPIYRIYMGRPSSQGVEVRELGLSWTYIPNWSTLRGSFTASHEGYYSGEYDERYTKAFDGNKQTKFTAMGTDNGPESEGVWVQMQANNEKRYVFNYISFYAGNEGNRRPHNITVLASNGDNIWTVLSTKTFSWSSSNGWNYHEDWSFENTEAYNIYRIRCLESGSNDIEIAEVTLSNALVADVPVPAIGGTVIASHVGFYDSSYDERYYLAVDKKTNTKLTLLDSSVASGESSFWLQWAPFNPDGEIINHVQFYAGNTRRRRPENVTITASNDGSLWNSLDSHTLSWQYQDGYGQVHEWDFDNYQRYAMYRVYFSKSESEGIEVAELTLSYIAPPTTIPPTTLPPTTVIPTTEAPTTEVPTTEVPTTEAPTTEVPTTEAPTTLPPTVLPPTTLPPTTLPPTAEIPTTLPPTTVIPTAEIPTTLPPTTVIPTAEVPTTEVPTTEAPTTEVPTTELPTTLPPTTLPPTTLPPTAEVPTTEVPTTELPTTLPPTVEVPTTEAPTTEVPTTELPTTLPPTAEAPTTVIPTAEVPTTEVPTTELPTTLPPTVLPPTTLPPTTEAPTTLPPTTEAPTTLPPTTELPTTLPPTTLPPTTLPPTTLPPTTLPPTTLPPTTLPPTTLPPTTEPPTTEIPTTEVPTTEPPTTPAPITCPANSDVPESVVGTILYVSCAAGFIGQVKWTCSAPEGYGVWVKNSEDCIPQIPPEGKIYIPFLITCHNVNNYWTDDVLSAVRQAYANVLSISAQYIQLWEKKEAYRRLLDTLTAYGQIEATPEEEPQLLVALVSSTAQVDAQLKIMDPTMFPAEYYTTLDEHPAVPTLLPTTLPPTTLPPTTLPPTTLPPTTLPPTSIPTISPTTIVPTAPLVCTSGFVEVTFSSVSGSSACQIRVSDITGKSNGLLLINGLETKKKYCLNPGYYYVGCEDTAVVNVNYDSFDKDFSLQVPALSVVLAISDTDSPYTTVPEAHTRPDFDKSKPLSGKPAYPADPTDHKSDYTCDQSGYLRYLNAWPETMKCTSRDVTTTEFQTRLEYFIDSCEKIHDWNLRGRYDFEFTFYADWDPMEFEELTTTKQRYTGVKAHVPFTVPVYNNSNWRYLMPSSDPCDDVFEGRENHLRELVCKPQNCSVSWAFAVTNSIEYAIKKLYLDTYDQLVEVALSAQELIDCVGKEHDMEGKVCDGLPIAWGFDYAFENGIAFRQFYPQTGTENQCQFVPDEQKYHIAGYEKPHVYNKLGLFELVMKGPTAVSMGLDPEYFQYYRNDRAEGPYFTNAYWRPSVYGVVVEYLQYAVEGAPEFAEWPYFAVESRLRACDSFVYRLPIRETTSDANIAGIAGFAIRPVVNELLPTPQPPAIE